MNKTKILVQFSVIYALIGTFLGSHMAGDGSMLFRAIHAHILVVGWLSLFAFGIFYAVFAIPKNSKLAKWQVITALIGSFGLSFGMWMHYFQPAWAPDLFSLLFYIVGGTILVISFILFAVIAFYFGDLLKEKQA
ncbi:hypothetical protein FLK61_27585 [Paenalkalicoccus suaedae]|uniref:Cytochrome-c oxidase n=1 Tax=Paenalkalicoccus suaedae TaxID=2592382 RepID=A0A859FE70_9BACI|nr:hypothetical protein [Paenalkalicoccus suaedae]QKS70516.1 hypothetical protein FLK61_27585 [Paenalkalicoccus suaedae]